jgi:hypothetical protein
VLTVNTQFEFELKKIVIEELKRLRDCMENPATIKDHSIYSFYVGQINALNRVLDTYIDEVNTKINKRD